MEPVDDVDPLVRVTWHVPRSMLDRLREQSRLSGAPVAEVVRRSLDAVTPGLGAKVSSEVILPATQEPVPDLMAALEDSLAVAKEAPSRRPHRWVSVAKDSPVRHCERCHLTERTWQKHGGQPEVCDG
jgi:hypothetical protein